MRPLVQLQRIPTPLTAIVRLTPAIRACWPPRRYWSDCPQPARCAGCNGATASGCCQTESWQPSTSAAVRCLDGAFNKIRCCPDPRRFAPYRPSLPMSLSSLWLIASPRPLPPKRRVMLPSTPAGRRGIYLRSFCADTNAAVFHLYPQEKLLI